MTGSLPDEHRIPSLAWYHRGERRFVEYGSSFAAAAAAEGRLRTIEDSVVNLNLVHLAPHPRTIFERVEDAGLIAACVNCLVFRGRHRHTMKHGYGALERVGHRTRVAATYGPTHFFFGELFGARRPRTPQVAVKRPRDWSAAHITRWLMRHSSSDFLLMYLGDHDVASHKSGPHATQDTIRAADRGIARVLDGVGGIDAFLEDGAIAIVADHGQSTVNPGQYARLEDVFDDIELFHGSRSSDWEACDLAIAPSNRVALIYRLHGDSPPARWVALRALRSPAADVVAFREGGRVIALRDGRELSIERCDPDDAAGMQTLSDADRTQPPRWRLDGDLDVLDLQITDNTIHDNGAYPDALRRLDAALRCATMGDVVVSAKVGWEFVDIGGTVHPGGSHGSLHREDSVAPVILAGVPADLARSLPRNGMWRLADVTPLLCDVLGVDRPRQRPLRRAPSRTIAAERMDTALGRRIRRHRRHWQHLSGSLLSRGRHT